MSRFRITVRRTLTVRTQVRRIVRTQAHFAQTGHRTIETTARVLPAASISRDLAEDGYGPIDEDREFDLFLSHATEDKDFVRPLADALTRLGVRVWFDETAISIGASVRESIDRGLTRSRFGVVVFSKSFFAKAWTGYELNGLVAREMQGRKVILPVWRPGLVLEDVIKHSPPMADKKALVGSSLSIEQIAQELADLVLDSGGDQE
jgi:hypothetical protein